MKSVFALPLLTLIVHSTSPATGPSPDPPVASTPASAAANALDSLLREYDAWRFHEFPELARAHGMPTRDDAIAEVGIAAEGRRRGQRAVFMEDLNAIDPSALGEADRLDFDLIRGELQQSIDRYDRGLWLFAVGPHHGPQHSLGRTAEGMRFDSATDYENYLKRLSWVPQNLANVVEILREGVRRGLVPPKASMAAVPAQFDEAMGAGMAALREPLTRFPAGVPEPRRTEFLREFDERLLPAIRTAMQDLAAMVRSEYLNACRDSTGFSELPGGSDLYRFELAAATTLSPSPEEMHAAGLREVTRLRTELVNAIRGSDWCRAAPERAALEPSALVAAFRSDPRLRPASIESMLAEYRDICKRTDAALPALFGELPRLPYGVRAMPDCLASAQPSARHDAGSLATGEPGWLNANAFALDQRPRCDMIPIALHEAVPGHHLQRALANELPGLRAFRRDLAFPAFVEGWAIYAERLGIEMGMYATTDAEVGRLCRSLREAAAMVADTGMHGMGWSRDRAIAYLREQAELSESESRSEVDRAITWPGLACAGPIGAMKMLQLRSTAASALGEQFRLRAFHDVLLSGGAIPLPQLEDRVRHWIDAERSRGSGTGDAR